MVVLTAAVLFCWSDSQAQDKDRFLPSTEIAKISFTIRQEQQSLHLKVTNDSLLSLTSVSLSCKGYNLARPRPILAPDGQEWCEPRHYVVAGSEGYKVKPCVSDLTYTGSIAESVLPRKSKEFYFEVDKKEWPFPLQCVLNDLRGRKPKFWEF